MIGSSRLRMIIAATLVSIVIVTVSALQAPLSSVTGPLLLACGCDPLSVAATFKAINRSKVFLVLANSQLSMALCCSSGVGGRQHRTHVAGEQT